MTDDEHVRSRLHGVVQVLDVRGEIDGQTDGSTALHLPTRVVFRPEFQVHAVLYDTDSRGRRPARGGQYRLEIDGQVLDVAGQNDVSNRLTVARATLVQT